MFLENEDVRMIRWVGGETTALKQMQQRLAVEYETFLRYEHNMIIVRFLLEHGRNQLLA